MSEATADRPVTTADVPPRLFPLAAGRVGKSLAVGLEGAGVVIDAGANAQHLLGKVVSAGAGRMYTQYRRLPASEIAPFPDGVTAEQGASAYVNPLTALGMLSTMRREGHSALVHTAAATNLDSAGIACWDGIETRRLALRRRQPRTREAVGAR